MKLAAELEIPCMGRQATRLGSLVLKIIPISVVFDPSASDSQCVWPGRISAAIRKKGQHHFTTPKPSTDTILIQAAQCCAVRLHSSRSLHAYTDRKPDVETDVTLPAGLCLGERGWTMLSASPVASCTPSGVDSDCK